MDKKRLFEALLYGGASIDELRDMDMDVSREAWMATGACIMTCPKADWWVPLGPPGGISWQGGVLESKDNGVLMWRPDSGQG